MAQDSANAGDPTPLGRHPDDPGPIWEGLVVLASVIVVAVIASVIRAVVDGSSNPLLAALAAIVGGAVTWLALRRFFYRPGSRFTDHRFGVPAKDLLLLGGPPLVALFAALFAR